MQDAVSPASGEAQPERVPGGTGPGGAVPHPVFDSPLLRVWATAEAAGLQKLLRLFRALDTAACGTCSHEDFRYVVMAGLGKRALSQEEQQLLCQAFSAPPMRDAAARARGTHQRVACAPTPVIEQSQSEMG